MKKIIYTLFLFFALNSFSQKVKLPEFDKIEEITNDNTENLEIWLKVSSFYNMQFEKTPIGIKHLISKIKSVLYLNNADFNKPIMDMTFLPSYVKDLNDYERLNTAINLGDAEVEISWNIGNSPIFISLTKEAYVIRFIDR